MLISAMVGIDSRATMDIDTTLRNYALNCESAEQIVRQIADVEIDDKISFVIKKTEEIMEDSSTRVCGSRLMRIWTKRGFP